MTQIKDSTEDKPEEPEFEGSWEQSGKSLTTAAILGFIIVAVIYFYAQGFIAFIAMALHGTGSTGTAGNHRTLIEILSARATESKQPIRYSVIISQFIFLLLPTIWLIRRWHTKHVVRYIRIEKIPVFEIILAFMGAVLFFPVSAGISNFFMNQLHFPDFLARIDSLVFASNTPSELIWVIVIVCVTPAICEETLFRGYVQRTLERTIGGKSVLVAGILFGLYHMRPLNLLSLSLFGILIGYFVYRSKSLLPSMTAHFTYNLIAILSLYKMTEGRSDIPFASLHVPLIIVVMGAVGTVVIALVYRNTTERNFTSKQRERRVGEEPQELP